MLCVFGTAKRVSFIYTETLFNLAMRELERHLIEKNLSYL